MKKASFTRVSIDGAVLESPIARAYAESARRMGASLEAVEGEAVDRLHDGHNLSSGKREVLVTRARGRAVRPCTGLEPQYVCCNLHVMNQTTNCPLDCSYCILQSYVNRPVTTVAANTAELLEEARAACAAQPRRLFRIGTGDLGDSLALDGLGRVSVELVPGFARIPNAVLELKTKSNQVDGLLGLDHGGRVLVSWSLNTDAIVRAEEHGCASLDERLEAARRVADAGYMVGFHFDPMILHDGWETGYPEVVERILGSVPQEQLVFVSLGALRFPPAMKKTIEQRFPKTGILNGELVHGSDGKMRYLKPLRIALYRSVVDALDRPKRPDRIAQGRRIFRYLCMEVPEVWKRALSRVPESNHALDFELATHLWERFPHLMPERPRFDDYRGASSLGGPSGTQEGELGGRAGEGP